MHFGCSYCLTGVFPISWCDSGITENWHSASFHRHIGLCDAVTRIMHSSSAASRDAHLSITRLNSGVFSHYPPTTPCNNLLISFVLVFHSSGAPFRHIKVSFSYPYFNLNQLANHVTQILDNAVPTSNRMVTTSNRYAPSLLLDTTSPAATWTPATATSSRSTTCQWWKGPGADHFWVWIWGLVIVGYKYST